ncbi:hypothetical protein [Chitinophaga sancti]|nr:hypothetical protein [Chitinophaga sancti]WQD63618.1 hypothetical protein U0033_04365 [Chitinophaga sancti]WQG90757.1 hypothetical protein SR876_04555 [Chitinophaga sancti]
MAEFKEYGFKIGYPDEWKRGSEANVLSVCKMNCKESQVFCPKIVLNIVAKKEGALLSNYADFFLKKVKEKLNDMHSLSSQTMLVNGYQCTILDFRMSVSGTNLGSTNGIIDLGNFILFVNCMGDNDPVGNYSQYRALFSQVIKSVAKI